MGRSGVAYTGRAGATPLSERTRPADLASLYVSPEVGASSEGHIFREACERPEPCRTPAPPRCTTPPRYQGRGSRRMCRMATSGANFSEHRKDEVRRKTLLRGWVDSPYYTRRFHSAYSHDERTHASRRG